jgi:tetratricopeptide (TPR) repeat protein
MLAFIFVGIFVGLSSGAGANKIWSFSFLSDPRKSFFSILLLIVLMIISAGISFKFIERFASVAYLGKVFSATDMPQAEFAINRAVLLNANDLYFRTGTQVYATKINTLLNKVEALTEQEKVDLQNSFDIALNSAGQAVAYNPSNYLNYESLGGLYQLATTIGVEGASTKAIEAYTKALELNPLNPGLKLAIGRLYLAEGKTADAKMYIQESLTLKPDYIDALIISSQVERSEGNITKAISLAEQALSLSPTDQNLVQYVNALKGINTPKPNPVEENTEEKTTE